MSARVPQRINVREVNRSEHIPVGIGSQFEFGQTPNRVGDRSEPSKLQKNVASLVAATVLGGTLWGLSENNSGNTDNGIPLETDSSVVQVGDNEIPKADYDKLIQDGVIVIPPSNAETK